MKKIFISLGLLIVLSTSLQAQSTIANGAICPNFTMTDTKGVQHKLYDYCNAGNMSLSISLLTGAPHVSLQHLLLKISMRNMAVIQAM